MTMVSTGSMSRFSSLAFAIVACVAMSVAWTPPARAATDAEQAESLIREGVNLRAKDSAALALPLFEKAYQISRTGRTAAQLGLCELELGYCVEADRYLTEALAADHPWIAKNKAALKKPLETARANIGELVLVVSPANADVSLNNKPLDRSALGAPIRLGKGLVDLEVWATGYVTARETVILSGGKREQRTITLVREAVASGGSTVTPTLGAGAPPPETSAAVTLTASSAPAEGRKSARTAAWITGGAAAAALVFGTVEAIGAAGKSSDFNDHTSTAGGVTYHDCGTNNLSAACKALKDDYDQSVTLSIVGFVGAGVLAAASTVLFMYSSADHGERAGAVGAVACVPDPIGRGIGCSLRF